MALPGYPNLDDTYKYMNDEEDRGGRRWASDISGVAARK
jgi:hypothetical protein